MGATLEQLYQDIRLIKQNTAEVDRELRQFLSEYVSVLGRSVSKQLVLSSFHLCTQVYPEAFLGLTVSERESLQHQVQHLGSQLTSALQETLHSLKDTDQDEVDPTSLLEQWETVETNMLKTLQDGTRQINQQLIDHCVMSVKLLEKLLSTANQAQESGRTITNPPHLLKALVDEKDLLEEGLDPVIVIYLQLSDLEFTYPELMSWRQKLRPLRQKLMQIQQSYTQKLEEQLTAEAIAAWRASWTDSRFLDGGATDG